MLQAVTGSNEWQLNFKWGQKAEENKAAVVRSVYPLALIQSADRQLVIGRCMLTPIDYGSEAAAKQQQQQPGPGDDCKPTHHRAIDHVSIFRGHFRRTFVARH